MSEQVLNPSTPVANGVAVTTAAPMPVTLVGGVSPTTIALGTPITGGAANQLLYADGTSTLAEVTKANSQVLVTNSSGVPAFSATLPSGLAATNLTLTTPILGTPQSGVLTNCTGTASGLTAGVASAVAVGGITGLGTGVATALAATADGAGGFSTVVSGATAWTPTDASGAALTFTSVTAYYYKIGKLVFAAARLTYPVTADGSAALIGGLPFASFSTGGPVIFFAADVGSATGSGIAVTQNATTLIPLGANGAGQSNAQMSGVTMLFSITYITN